MTSTSGRDVELEWTSHLLLQVCARHFAHRGVGVGGGTPKFLGGPTTKTAIMGDLCVMMRRPAGTNRILVPPVTSATVGSRSFPVAALLIWNSLPDDVISAESLPTFQRKLKRHLFCQSFPGFCY